MNNLWPHQERGLKELADAIEAGERRICFTSPTGGGKTFCLANHILRNDSENVVVHTHRKILKEQLASSLGKFGIEYGIIASGDEQQWAPVQIAMLQTLVSQSLKGNRTLHPATQIIWDEAHLMSGDTSLQLREKYGEDVIDIGLTATPLGIGHVYDKLIVAGVNSELRKTGALVPAYHFGPCEPDTKWIGKVKIDGGECGIVNNKRMEYAHRVFGNVVDNYWRLNAEQKPTILFAPGVKESIWFAEELTKKGIRAAHIDGEDVWLDGEQIKKDQGLVEEIRDRLADGDIKVVSTRFVLREGVDWPFVEVAMFATVFGSLTSYLQAGGRVLRASPSTGKTQAVIIDFGGNWHRHGSVNSDRTWNLLHDDRIVAGLRAQAIREKREPEPIVCPKCNACRLSGPTCHSCGFSYNKRVRQVLQRDGSLREMRGDIYRQRRQIDDTEKARRQWINRIKAIRRSQKPSVAKMTYAQAESAFAYANDWKYPRRDWPEMPINEMDWFLPVKDVVETT